MDDKSLRKISRSKCSFFPTKFRFELMGTVTVLSTDADVTMPLIDTERRIILPSFSHCFCKLRFVEKNVFGVIA